MMVAQTPPIEYCLWQNRLWQLATSESIAAKAEIRAFDRGQYFGFIVTTTMRQMQYLD
jgi:hypothetical protein